MRKSILFGGAAVVLAAASVGGWQWAQTTARAEIETIFASLRSAGIDAKYASVDVDLWSRGVQVGGISLKGALDAGADIKIETARAEGVSLWSGARTPKRVELSGVETRVAVAGGTTGTYDYRAPQIILTDFEMPDAGTARASGRPDEQLARVIARLKAASIVAPEMSGSTEVRAPTAAPRGSPPVSVRVEFKYSGFRLDGLGDGRIAVWSADRAVMTGAAGSPFTEATFDGMKATGIDIMPFLGAGLGARKPVDGLYEVQSRFEMGGMKMSILDGSAVSVGSVTGERFRIDPARLAYPKMQELAKKLETISAQPPSPIQAAAAVEAVVQIYEGLAFGAFEIKAMEISGPKTARQSPGFKVDSVRLSGLDRGKLEEFRISGVEARVPDLRRQSAPFRLDSFTLHGLDFVGIMRVSAAAQQTNVPMSPEQGLRLLSMLQSVELTGLSGVDPTTRTPLKIDRARAGWSQFVNGIPTRVHMSYKGEKMIGPGDANLAPLVQMGFQSLSMDVDLAAAYDDTTRTIEIGPLSAKVDRLGSMAFRTTLGNVSRDVFSIEPGAFMAALPSFTVGPFETKLTDDGAIGLVQSAAALGAAPGAPAPDPALFLRQLQDDPSLPKGNIVDMIGALARFVQTPRQTLAIRATPRQGVPLNILLSIAPGPEGKAAAAAVLDRFTVETTVTPAP